jgi:hypothetical protein
MFDVHADLNRCAAALERIADCLDKLCPPIYPMDKEAVKVNYSIEQATNEDTYEHEVEDQLKWFADKAQMLMKEYGDQINQE